MLDINRSVLYAKLIKLIVKYINYSEHKEKLQDHSQVESDANEFVATIEKLGSTFIKLGQVFQTREDLLPPIFIKKLQKLQDDVDPVPYSDIEEIIEKELKYKPEVIFDSFDRKPLSTASLGQVHKAKLKSGEDVVVKIQKPNIKKKIQQDISLIKQAISLLNEVSDDIKRYHLQGVIEDFKENIEKELNYREEASSLVAMRENLEEFENIIVPNIYKSYSTNKIITMDFIRGEKISELSHLRSTEVKGEQIVEEVFEAYLKQILVDGLIHCDPHMGNILLIDNSHIGIIDLGMTTKLDNVKRRSFQELFLYISEGKAHDAAETAYKMTRPIDGIEEDLTNFKDRVSKLISNDEGKAAAQLNIGESLMAITKVAAQSGLRFPSEFTSIARTLIYLDTLVNELYSDFNPQKSLKKHVLKYMKNAYMEEASLKQFINDSIEFKNTVEKLPKKLEHIIDGIINKRLELKLDVIDENKLIKGFEKVANRVTTGLILAAMIIGSTEMMKYQTNSTIFGYPSFAMILLLLATLGSLILIVNVFIKDR